VQGDPFKITRDIMEVRFTGNIKKDFRENSFPLHGKIFCESEDIKPLLRSFLALPEFCVSVDLLFRGVVNRKAKPAVY
jgi:hypothetical protein